jgi:hypothetical protein
MLRLILAAFLLLVGSPAAAHSARARPDVAALLATDRGFAAAAAHAPSVADALAPMLDAEAVMPVPGRGLAIGREAVLAAVRAADNAPGGLGWTPVRAGISADGSQGFTFGFLTLAGGDPARRNRKYLAYWIRRPAGWRVVAYRQNVRAPGAVSTAMLPPALPTFAARPVAEPARDAANRASLAAAEQAFSDRAQAVGLAAAFREYGRADAMNMYNGAGFTLGPDAIAAGFPAAETRSPVHWSTRMTFVASSGDLGVSIGIIRRNGAAGAGAEVGAGAVSAGAAGAEAGAGAASAPAGAEAGAGAGAGDGAGAGEPPGFPFFTVWRRDGPNAPWRYVAE